MPADRPIVRCAIYTRKSSEEGLEQTFNSLDAQREACCAYIESQKHEGWKAIGTVYDDGGYSGGHLERPALKALLSDIDAGHIQTVVVYKVDRLTRSLADFAKIVEIFDAKAVSFVSVTQQFNTTTSMGRLTLNVLLSFAQFEREVTAERIRDKIAASKRKGLWMGGNVPLGCDIKDRTLAVNAPEAQTVRAIFKRYLKLQCVSQLKCELDKEDVRSKLRTTKAGFSRGDKPFSRGALYHLLKNRIYLGEIVHREKSYAGSHEPIIARELWDKVQSLLKAHTRREGPGRPSEMGLLTGLLFDSRNNRFTHSYTVKDNKRYRYYVCPRFQQTDNLGQGGVGRIPAHGIEELVIKRLSTFLTSPEMTGISALPEDIPPSALVKLAKTWLTHNPGGDLTAWRMLLVQAQAKVIVGHTEIMISLSGQDLLSSLRGITPNKKATTLEHDIRLKLELSFKRQGHETQLIIPPSFPYRTPKLDPTLINAMARGFAGYRKLTSGASLKQIVAEEGVHKFYLHRTIRCALLAPDIVRLILEGQQPLSLTLDKLFKPFPLDWAEQRKFFGIAST